MTAQIIADFRMLVLRGREGEGEGDSGSPALLGMTGSRGEASEMKDSAWI